MSHHTDTVTQVLQPIAPAPEDSVPSVPTRGEPPPAAAYPDPELPVETVGSDDFSDRGDDHPPFARAVHLPTDAEELPAEVTKPASGVVLVGPAQPPNVGKSGDEQLVRRLRGSLASANHGMVLVLASALDFLAARENMAHGRWLPWLDAHAPRLGWSERNLRRHVALADGLLVHLAQIGQPWPVSQSERLAQVLRARSPRDLSATERDALDAVREVVAGRESRAALQAAFRTLPRLSAAVLPAGASVAATGKKLHLTAKSKGDEQLFSAKAPLGTVDAWSESSPSSAVANELRGQSTEVTVSASPVPALIWDVGCWRAEATASLIDGATPRPDAGATPAGWRVLRSDALSELIDCLEVTLGAMRAYHCRQQSAPAPAGEDDNTLPLFAGF